MRSQRPLREPELVGIADHPVAAASIKRVKSLAGLVGFAATLALGLRHHALLSTVCLHALAVGVGAYVVAWTVAVTVWRQILRAHARAVVKRAIANATSREQ